MISVEWPKDTAPNYEAWLKIAANFEAALASKDAAISEIRAELERLQDEEDKAARDMQAVIQGLRDRATSAEVDNLRLRGALAPFAKAGFDKLAPVEAIRHARTFFADSELTNAGSFELRP
ncbi:hypothetical protein FJ951_26835 [Mesorhizobium sp. B2-2-3]|uniref:hypothetical protein n=1 Tax=Mesorhizobium sp. B2-2-3 TaxID=2589963 RepID=UPI00112A5824|nr:hypothetical protein [Mesorhizobium sp. B2-2-3]TPM39328.1 hypothetical protein FJ951_26835 [Mesorhizobium sp. B2-2-3]